MLRLEVKILFALLGGIALVLALNLRLAELKEPAQAEENVFFVAPEGRCGEGTVVFPNCYADIQTAIDAAAPGTEIRVAAGIYTDVNTYGGLAQVVYISKTVTVRGGYTVTNWTISDPLANPTVLDAGGRGRVLYIEGNISPTIEGVQITNGDTAELGRYPGLDVGGGGVYIRDARATLEDVRIVGNVADCGGGIYLLNSAATLRRSQILSNTGTVCGGGVSLENSPAYLTGNIIARNVAQYGGGCYLNASEPVIEGNSILDNWGQLYGGGLHLFLSPARVERNVLVGNLAGQGGGVYLRSSAALVQANVIRGNFADTDGGGLYLFENSDAVLHNNVIAENSAADSGDGLYVAGSSPRLIHTTVAYNGATNGQGMYVKEYVEVGTVCGLTSSVTLTNTIISNQDVGIHVHEGNTVTLESTLWYSNTSNWTGAGEIQQRNFYTGDPAFIAPSVGDYHIGETSAALDAGVAAGVNEDLDGDPRPFGDGYDLGADEFSVPPLQVTKQAYPDPVNPGAQLTYTIRLTNTSSVDLHLTITDTIPSQAILASSGSGSVMLPGGTVVWSPVLLARGTVWTETIVVTVTPDYSGYLINTVQATSLGGGEGSYTEISRVGLSGPLVQAEDLDYATHAWHDAWDMNEGSSIRFFASPTCDDMPAMFSNAVFSDGIWSASYASHDPWLWLLDPGYRYALHVGKDGNVHPIDADIYTQLTFRMYLGGNFISSNTPGAKLIWTRKDSYSVPAEADEFGTSKFFRVFPGWHVYTVDLTKIGVQQGNLDWGGSITGLRLYPGIQTPGAPIEEVKIDWVRLTPKPSMQEVTWVSSWAGSAAVELLFSTGDTSYTPLKVYSNNEKVPDIVEPDSILSRLDGIGICDVPASFPPGLVTIEVEFQNPGSAVIRYAADPWQIEARPDLSFIAPSYTSGEEFSTSVVGNPWDMDSALDITSWEYLEDPPTYSGGILQAISISRMPNCGMPWGDPQLTLNMSGQAVNAHHYRYLTVRIKINAPFDFGNGWVSRFIWAKGNYSNYGVGNDMPLYTGWNTFHVDLWGDVLDDEVPGEGDSAWRSSLAPTILRFDPHEIPPATQFEVDYIKLTANDTASQGSVFEAKYELNRSENVTTTFCYDTDTNPDNGRWLTEEYTATYPPPPCLYFLYLPLTLRQYPASIGGMARTHTDLAGVPPVRISEISDVASMTFLWDLANVDAGTYYLCADVADGYATTTWYSETPVVITP